MNHPVFLPVRPAFRAIAATIVPEAAGLDEDGWEDAEDAIENTIANRSDALRRQLRLLVKVIDILPLLRYGRRFTALDDARRMRVLQWMQDSSFLTLRRGIWGLRTLIMLGYYSRPIAAAQIGYRASALGWEARP
jgi:hypothetical protein